MACNGKVEWVTWELVDGPETVEWIRDQIVGPAPQSPPDRDGKAEIRAKATQTARNDSEEPKKCSPERLCASEKVDPDKESIHTIGTYADPFTASGTDPNGIEWSARYQPVGDVRVKKIRHFRECIRRSFGKPMSSEYEKER